MNSGKNEEEKGTYIISELLESQNISYSTIRSTTTFEIDNNRTISSANKGLTNTTMDLDAGDTFLFKRSSLRENNEIGHDYTGFSVSPHVMKNYYQDKLREKSVTVFTMSSIFIAISFFIIFAIFGSTPFFWLNRDHEIGNFFTNNTLTIAYIICSFFMIVQPLRTLKAYRNHNKLDNILERWATIAFNIAEKDNSEQAFKDLLIRWDYVGENFVNDKVAESFENYILGLNKKEFSEIARNGITLSVIEQDLEKYANSSVYEKLTEEAQNHGNAVRKLILESFTKSFETFDNKVESDN